MAFGYGRLDVPLLAVLNQRLDETTNLREDVNGGKLGGGLDGASAALEVLRLM